MNRLVLASFVFLALLCPATLAAQDPGASPDLSVLERNILPYVQLDIMGAQKAYLRPEGLALMQTYSMDLDPFYKSFLYDRYSKKIGKAILLNVLTGGLGSWGMGDIASGAVLEAGMLGSFVCMLFAVAGWTAEPERREVFKWAAVASSSLVFAGGVAMPILSGGPANARLRKALNY